MKGATPLSSRCMVHSKKACGDPSSRSGNNQEQNGEQMEQQSVLARHATQPRFAICSRTVRFS